MLCLFDCFVCVVLFGRIRFLWGGNVLGSFVVCVLHCVYMCCLVVCVWCLGMCVVVLLFCWCCVVVFVVVGLFGRGCDCVLCLTCVGV